MVNKKRVSKGKGDQVNITVSREVWTKLGIEKLRNGFSTWDIFFKRILFILTKFKPELKE